ncbi:FtsW/RodA/SpoVE family cell cycle protein [Devriesea agamarum]|uniref:FtsW/RodA/SpoVE family cell cycle protein n=1 Tax=Devriesea agamarum TaxID=472569 RepID=UPI00071DCCDA|nr:FtsW/RodA/SpoVE family cell cycle protein [Devriesea agamarum]
MATVLSYAPRTRRATHAFLMLCAVAIAVGAHILVGIGRFQQVPDDIWIYAGVFLAFGVLLHVIVCWKAPYADPVIAPVAVLINGLGVALIASVDGARQVFEHKTFGYADRQLMWTALGIILCCVVMLFLRDHRLLRRYTWISALAGIALLLMPLLPLIGHEENGSRIWIKIAGFSFQPGEIAKICFAIFFAGYLVSRRDTLALAGPKLLGIHFPRWRDFGPILVAWVFGLAVLVFETDLGTSLLFFGLFVAALYIATDRLSWIIIGFVMFVPPAVFAATHISHVQTRMTCWIDPLARENYDRCYQVAQGLFGMANGGITGAGLGQGRPNLVPFSWSDFIFSTAAEELGLVGIFAILILYLVLIERAFRTGVGISDGFGKLLAGGLAFVTALQIFVVIGGITRVIPLTGLTLPFMAAGGSSLIANWMIIGLLLRMSDSSRRPDPKPVSPDDPAVQAALAAQSLTPPPAGVKAA